MAITSREVAKHANVSISTVSRAFRNDAYVSKAAKQRVFDAAKELGYTPNLLASGLRNQKTRVIGLIISDIDNPFYSVVTKLIETELKNAGYRLLLSFSNESTEQELDILQLFSSSRAEGIIFTPASSKNQGIINNLKKQKIHLAQMFRKGYNDIDTVMFEDGKGAYIATKHLIHNGHSNILFLVKNYSEISLNGKVEGFKAAFQDEKIKLNDSQIMYLPYNTDFRGMITERIQSLKPTAIIAGTNIIGKDVIKVCKEMKLSIPDDISFVMFDDVDWASIMDITTISQPINEISTSICKIILGRIEGKQKAQAPIISTLEPVLISRTSVKNLYLK